MPIIDFFDEIPPEFLEILPDTDTEDDPANPPRNIVDGEAEKRAAIEDLSADEEPKPKARKPAKGGHKKRPKIYDTLNIPVTTFVEIRHWRDALIATDPDRKWTYEAVLVEMMKALASKNEEAYAKYKEMTTVQDTQRPLQERTAAMRKSTLKKKKKNLGYVLLKVGGIQPCRLKIYPGKKEWKYGKEVRKPDYCHVPMHIPYDKNYPRLRAGKNIPIDVLLKHPGAKRQQNLRPITVGVVEISEQDETKTYKLRRSSVTGKEYFVMRKKKQKLEEVKNADTDNKVKVTYIVDESVEPSSLQTESEPRDL